MESVLTMDREVLAAVRADLLVGCDGESSLVLDDATYTFTGLSPQALRTVIDELDGTTAAGSIATKTGISESTVRTVIQHLLDLGLATDTRGALATISPSLIASACRRLFVPWKQRLFGHPLWVSLVSGEATESQFFGWLLESYHFIEGVNDRLALAVAECTIPAVRELFARHYREEYDHSAFFLDALEAFGCPRSNVLRSRPLPGTRAVLNFMRQCARHDPLQYAVCSGFLESTGTDRENARAFLDRVKVNYAEDRAGAVHPLVAHVALDEDYGHGGMLESVCEAIGPVASARASVAIDAGLRFVETLELWSTDIARYYRSNALREGVRLYRPYQPASEPLSPIAPVPASS